jgi:hypothetical protein
MDTFCRDWRKPGIRPDSRLFSRDTAHSLSVVNGSKRRQLVAELIPSMIKLLRRDALQAAGGIVP